jgi:hypothetical protein
VVIRMENGRRPLRWRLSKGRKKSSRRCSSRLKKMTEELAGLERPGKEEARIAGLIAALEKGTATLMAEPTGPKAACAYAEANRIAAELGLFNCSI